ncbi:hypothetical protein [Silvimonas soli]|nr:hypothetical protein [Silvimonas soli]
MKTYYLFVLVSGRLVIDDHLPAGAEVLKQCTAESLLAARALLVV